MFLSSRHPNDRDELVITYSQRHRQTQMRFPLLFAVPTDDARDRVSLYQATLLREGPDRWGDTPSVYLVAPYRIFHGHDDTQWPDEAFVRTRDPRTTDERPNHDVLLVADYPTRPRHYGEEVDGATPDRRPLYRGAWRHDAATVFSMYCSAPIPILRFPHGQLAPWPTARYNRLPLTRASMAAVRAWVRRWDPTTWRRDIRLEEEGGASAAAAYNSSDSDEEEEAPVPVLLPSPATATATHPLPTFVAAALISDAVARTLACPITMEPINPATATVTPCYHVFDADALSVWVAQQLAHDGAVAPTCPVCKVGL